MADERRAGLGAVGLVGLGRMGRAIAGRLAGAGLLHAVANRTVATAHEEAERLGVRACESPAELAATSDVIVTVIADAGALQDVFAGEHGLLEAIRAGTLCIEMSTVGPASLEPVANRLTGRGCALIDAPVSGSVAFAETGELTILAGGDPADVERARPLLARLGRQTLHLGPLGAGATMKLAVNNVVYGLNQSVAESLVLAERAGIDRELAYEAIAHSAAAAPFVHYRRAHFERPEAEPAQMEMALAAKDLALIEALGAQVGAPLPQAAVNHRVVRASVADHARDDVTAVAQHLRHQASQGDR